MEDTKFLDYLARKYFGEAGIGSTLEDIGVEVVNYLDKRDRERELALKADGTAPSHS